MFGGHGAGEGSEVLMAIVTALLAVLVFVLTQSFLKLVLEPVQEQLKLIGEVAHALLFYANLVPYQSRS